jgi:hypothetical protein
MNAIPENNMASPVGKIPKVPMGKIAKIIPIIKDKKAKTIDAFLILNSFCVG